MLEGKTPSEGDVIETLNSRGPFERWGERREERQEEEGGRGKSSVGGKKSLFHIFVLISRKLL